MVPMASPVTVFAARAAPALLAGVPVPGVPAPGVGVPSAAAGLPSADWVCVLNDSRKTSPMAVATIARMTRRMRFPSLRCGWSELEGLVVDLPPPHSGVEQFAGDGGGQPRRP